MHSNNESESGFRFGETCLQIGYTPTDLKSFDLPSKSETIRFSVNPNPDSIVEYALSSVLLCRCCCCCVRWRHVDQNVAMTTRRCDWSRALRWTHNSRSEQRSATEALVFCPNVCHPLSAPTPSGFPACCRLGVTAAVTPAVEATVGTEAISGGHSKLGKRVAAFQIYCRPRIACTQLVNTVDRLSEPVC